MQRTIFNTPIISHFFYLFSIVVLKLTGWKAEGVFPKDLNKAVVIAAPHTTNWDMPFSLMIAFKLKLPIYWLGKQSIFKFPFGGIMRWMGGIPVERSKSNNLVGSLVDRFAEQEHLLIMMAPEGTRAQVTAWKSGFYHIAYSAKVPIVLAYIDYRNKRGGVGPTFIPTGDYEQDLAEIQRFYDTFRRP
ncbi:1-acyl-sn-glycerol-3-phosphate acyltransferases [Oceanospirillum multiglobuliferum]|uniref:Glycerol acyltransferase n=1 Tax=Oceanospirillum multiglobuliferum TaxID=64969 RepID=A0A1T4R788_9GAMM|nr:lysophospholipid acyltransferase family protein [Oceanospirillum multiglobuliferum]OPX55203.1 glycerol acyltransferase [Oceanospirillum multiglobuliferum]SKA11686.1 1-acyl-sn-glycerol-3-phosphate acyltransferases [Oceanospirillum multiglobuliferum]